MSTHAPETFVDFIKFFFLWVWFEGNLVVKFFVVLPFVFIPVLIWRKLRGEK